jgi:hypothetical protein
MVDASGDDLGVRFTQNKNGDVMILRHGRATATLRVRLALANAAAGGAAAQQPMARLLDRQGQARQRATCATAFAEPALMSRSEGTRSERAFDRTPLV